MSTSVFVYNGKLPEEKIHQRMAELSEKIRYRFKDISWLKKAFYTGIETDTNVEKYANSPMATLGDRVLSLIITEKLFDEGKTSGEITTTKSCAESNDRWREISIKHDLRQYAFNDEYFFYRAPKHEQLPHGKHDRYFEALAAAVYKDSSSIQQTAQILMIFLEIKNIA